MRLVAVNVGMPREVEADGRRVTTGIFKVAVAGRVRLATRNLDGDGQADLSVHGGAEKAVYAYASEHYAGWRSELPDVDLPWGAFGENLDTEGLLEDRVCVGDTFRAGTAVVRVTGPRLPCFKLGIKFGRPEIIRSFLASGRTGFYLAVESEGQVAAGDAIEVVRRDPHGLTIAEIVRLHGSACTDVAALRRAIDVPALPEGWRTRFAKRLAAVDG